MDPSRPIQCGSILKNRKTRPCLSKKRRQTRVGHPSCSAHSGVLGGQLRESRPVQVLATVGQQGQEPVVDQAGDGQRHAQGFARGQHEAIVFKSQRSCESGRLELLVGDQSAVGLVTGALKSVEVRKSTYRCWSRPALPTRAIASPSDSITEEIRKLPLSFTRFASGGLLPKRKVFCPMAWKRDSQSSRVRCAGHGNEKLGRSRCFGAPKDRSGDKALPARRVRCRHPFRKRDADGARRNMDRALA